MTGRLLDAIISGFLRYDDAVPTGHVVFVISCYFRTRLLYSYVPRLVSKIAKNDNHNNNMQSSFVFIDVGFILKYRHLYWQLVHPDHHNQINVHTLAEIFEENNTMYLVGDDPTSKFWFDTKLFLKDIWRARQFDKALKNVEVYLPITAKIINSSSSKEKNCNVENLNRWCIISTKTKAKARYDITPQKSLYNVLRKLYTKDETETETETTQLTPPPLSLCFIGFVTQLSILRPQSLFDKQQRILALDKLGILIPLPQPQPHDLDLNLNLLVLTKYYNHWLQLKDDHGIAVFNWNWQDIIVHLIFYLTNCLWGYKAKTLSIGVFGFLHFLSGHLKRNKYTGEDLVQVINTGTFKNVYSKPKTVTETSFGSLMIHAYSSAGLPASRSLLNRVESILDDWTDKVLQRHFDETDLFSTTNPKNTKYFIQTSTRRETTRARARARFSNIFLNYSRYYVLVDGEFNGPYRCLRELLRFCEMEIKVNNNTRTHLVHYIGMTRLHTLRWTTLKMKMKMKKHKHMKHKHKHKHDQSINNKLKANFDIGFYLIKFLTENDYNEFALIERDLNSDPQHSKLVDAICSQFNFKDDDDDDDADEDEATPNRTQVWHALRILFVLEKLDDNVLAKLFFDEDIQFEEKLHTADTIIRLYRKTKPSEFGTTYECVGFYQDLEFIQDLDWDVTKVHDPLGMYKQSRIIYQINGSSSNDITLAQLIQQLESGQEVSLDTLKNTLLPFVTKELGEQVVNAIFEWCAEEEYNGLNFYEDIQEALDESMVMYDFNSSSSTISKQVVYGKIRLLLGIGHTSCSCTTLDWSVNQFKANEVAEARRFLNHHTCGVFSVEDVAVVQLVAIGLHNHNSDLLRIIYDVYASYEIEYQRKHRNLNDEFASTHTFPRRFWFHNNYFQQQGSNRNSSSSKQDIVRKGINNFYGRFRNIFLERNHEVRLIDDDINHYIEYTVMVQDLIHNLLQNRPNIGRPICPIQIDLVFIPKKFAFRKNINPSDDSGSDDDDDDDDSDSDSDDNDNHAVNYDEDRRAYFSRGTDIVNVFKEFNAWSGSDTRKQFRFAGPADISFGGKGQSVLREQFDAEFKEKHSTRFVILIDRRGEKHNDKDQCVIYRLPDEYSVIPEEHSFYYCIAATSQYLIPLNPDLNFIHTDKNIIGARHDSNGLFVISFECLQVDKIRMQWFTRMGSTRFHPDYMYRVWPQCFKDMKRLDEKKYNKHWLKQVWKLNTLDAEFDRWCVAMTPDL